MADDPANGEDLGFGVLLLLGFHELHDLVGKYVDPKYLPEWFCDDASDSLEELKIMESNT